MKKKYLSFKELSLDSEIYSRKTGKKTIVISKVTALDLDVALFFDRDAPRLLTLGFTSPGKYSREKFMPNASVCRIGDIIYSTNREELFEVLVNIEEEKSNLELVNCKLKEADVILKDAQKVVRRLKGQQYKIETILLKAGVNAEN